MSIEFGYKIIETASRGTIAIATRDFLPGDLVLMETEPVMFLSSEFLKHNDTSDPTDSRVFHVSFINFMKDLDHKQKAKLISLYGPTTGVAADNLRRLACSISYCPEEHEPSRLLTKEEVEMFVKVGSVVRLNRISIDDGGKAIFPEFSRFSHSCDANCAYSSRGTELSCRTTRSVKAGEELTTSYLAQMDLQPTHVRRHKYLEAKDFTCHCRRCDAPGDDTRQFDCCDPACKGVMMVCQPCNKEAIRFTNLLYTGVEYVEPYLLPCTVCRLTPPPAYQAKMLALETKLSDLDVRFAKTTEEMLRARPLVLETLQPVLEEILSLNLPRRHQMVVPILDTLIQIYKTRLVFAAKGLNGLDVDKCRALVQHTAREFLTGVEGDVPWTHPAVLDGYIRVCKTCIIQWENLSGELYVFPPLEAKELVQKAVRMQLILFQSRDTRKAELDAALLKILEQLPPQKHTQVCVFCEESPLRAAVTLSRCARCKQVCYCSAGCQKAHWTLHKKTCKAL